MEVLQNELRQELITMRTIACNSHTKPMSRDVTQENSGVACSFSSVKERQLRFSDAVTSIRFL